MRVISHKLPHPVACDRPGMHVVLSRHRPREPISPLSGGVYRMVSDVDIVSLSACHNCAVPFLPSVVELPPEVNGGHSTRDLRCPVEPTG